LLCAAQPHSEITHYSLFTAVKRVFMSLLVCAGIGFAGGILSGLMGVGGGIIL